ncbi:heavy metal translocating P-type ATPase [Clostridium sp. DL1XJH146]
MTDKKECCCSDHGICSSNGDCSDKFEKCGVKEKEIEKYNFDSSSENIVLKEYTLKGLNCAGCAAKIEKNVRGLEGIKEASLNFALSKLEVRVEKEDESKIANRIKDIVLALEPDVKVIDNDLVDCRKDELVSGNRENDENERNNKLIMRIGFSLAALVIGFLFKDRSWAVGIFLVSYLVIGYDIVLKSIKNIMAGEIFDENFLMSVATIAALGLKEYPEAIMVMLLYQVGEYFQDKAVESSRKSISDLMDIRPEYANLLIENNIKKVIPKEVKVGDIILVKPGEKVPLDGVVVEGNSSIDTKALTGESFPQDISEGNEIISGSVNIDGVLKIQVKKEFGESAVSKILDLVQNASAKKAKTELKITKFARYYTPTVVFVALFIALVPPLFISGQGFNEWILRGATFLVVSCPCALVISIPLSYFAGLGASSRKGVLVKGGNYLEALSNIGVVVFDKTGTLTEGEFQVTSINPEQGFMKEDLLRYTAYAEGFSTHPIGTSIVKYFINRGISYDKLKGNEKQEQTINKALIKNYKEIRGKGIEAEIEGKKVLSGKLNYLLEKGIKAEENKSSGTIVYTAIDGKYAGCITIKDKVKKDSKEAIKNLYQLGINKIVMLTGDRKVTGEEVARELGIKDFKYELLPDEKVEIVEGLLEQNKNNTLVFVGDGINDAPVLSRADIGIAMGGVGSDAAIEAADVVIMNDEPSKIIDAINIAKKTKRIANQNIFMALSVKFIIMILALFGLAPMWLAIFGDVGISIIAVFNSMRILQN